MKVLRNISYRISALLLGLLLVGCDSTGLEEPILEEMPVFICTHEKDRIPPRNPDADELFKHAEWLHRRHRMWMSFGVYRTSGTGVETYEEAARRLEETERLYRIAAAWGHDQAAYNLAYLIMGEHLLYEDTHVKPVKIAKDLIRRRIPSGYSLMSRILEEGHGVKKDPKASRQYLWKAINLGNPQAQNYMGDILKYKEWELKDYGFHDSASGKEVGKEMHRCAADQGDRDAASSVAYDLYEEGKHAESIKYYQIALMAGDVMSAKSLKESFDGQRSGLPEDKERAARYDKIFNSLSYSEYPYTKPTANEIDRIVPLPPAELPEWDGKTEWVEENKAPPLPSEKRIEEMALQKGLDPKTGWPLKK